MLKILDYFNDYSRTKECGHCDICIGKRLKTRPVNTSDHIITNKENWKKAINLAETRYG